jgi:hypothetical protein
MSKQLPVEITGTSLTIGDLSITFHRTLRIPDDGGEYPLPPSLGTFPIHRVDDYKDKVPESWRAHGGIFLPMYQREAMWLSFHSKKHWRPQALKVAVGMVDAISGKPWSETLDGETQDYLVCPPQPWLDGINAGAEMIKQFVAMPLGMGYTIEGQVTGEERFGGIQLLAFDPKEGVFTKPKYETRLRRNSGGMVFDSVNDYAGDDLSGDYYAGDQTFTSYAAPLGLPTDAEVSLMRSAKNLPKAAEMGLGAGGKMRQSIYPDSHGVATWDEERTGRVYVHIVNSEMYKQITGQSPPDSPISAQTYSEMGYPWFDLFDEHLGDVAKSEVFDGVKSIAEMDKEKGFEGQQDDSSIVIPDSQVVKYGSQTVVRDGDWSK